MALTLHGTVSDNTVALDRKTATPIIINGDMQIAQRGQSASSVSSAGFYSVDRYELFTDNSAVFTISNDTDVPTGYGFYKSYKIDVTTSDTLSGTETVRFRQIIEGQNLNVLKYNTSSAETITIAFWVKSNLTGNCVFRINNASASRHISKVFTINSADTWEKKVFTLVGDTAGAIPNTNAEGLRLEIGLGAGPDISSGSQPTTWQSNSTTADQYAGQVLDITTSTSNEFFITGFQAEVGSFDSNSIPDFQFEDVSTSLARCQRYYNRINAEAPYTIFGTGVSTTTTTGIGTIHLPVHMRALMTISDDGNFRFVDGDGSHAVTGLAFDGNSRGFQAFRFDATTSGLTDGTGGFLSANNDSTAYIEVDAEL